MKTHTATAQASPNIAFIKYWGNRHSALRLPVNGSISMNLANLHTRTTVTFGGVEQDSLHINGLPVSGKGLQRVSAILGLVRQRAGISLAAQVVSENNFPTGAGIASSASGFAALALAASQAAGLNLEQAALSRLARLGSGSASRSIPSGFVEWQMGSGDEDSVAVSIAPPEHWALADCVAVVAAAEKDTGSSEGHDLAPSSPLQAARVADAPRRLEICRRAILERDFTALAEIIEQDSDLMHAVMMTSRPALFYWQPATLSVMAAVRRSRREGQPFAYTIDAGANVHLICPQSHAAQAQQMLSQIPGVQAVLVSPVGGGALILP